MPKPDWWDESQMGPWVEGMDQPAPGLPPNQPYGPTNPYGPTGTPADLGPQNPAPIQPPVIPPVTPPAAPATPPVAPPVTPPVTPPVETPAAPVNPHDSDPNTPNTVDYEEIKDESGKTVGYNMYVDGVLKQTFDYSDLFQRLGEVEQPSTLQDWMQKTGFNIQDIQGTPEYAGLQALIEKLQNPETTAEDAQMAEEQAARAMGYASAEEMRADMERRKGLTAGGSSAMPGMSVQEREAFNRTTQSAIKQQETQMRRSVDQVLSGAVGNSTRNALMQANEYISQIRDTQIQADWQLATMNFDRQTQQFNEQWQMYKDLYDRGQVTEQMIYNELYRNRMGALQGYATEVSALLQQNQQYLQMYSEDLNRVRLAADMVYQSVQTELAVDANMRDAISDSFNQFWAEIMAPVNYQTALLENQALEQQNTSSMIGRGLSILGFIVGACLLFVPGAQALGVGLMGASATGYANS